MTQPAERIYDWLNTQLSIARFYGGCKINGYRYVIDYKDSRQPLVLVKPKARKRKETQG